MMPKRKSNAPAPQEVRDAAIELIERGISYRHAAAQMAKRFKRPVSEAAVRKWVRARLASSAPDVEAEDDAPPPALDAPAPEDAEEPDTDDLLEQTRRMLRNSKSIAKQASRDGNHAAAQRAQRDALGFATILARLEKDRAATADGVLFTREQLEAARRAVNERVEKLATDLARTGGLVCSHCGREIRIRLAKGD